LVLSTTRSSQVAVTELLAKRRPHRVDAARNFDAILLSAREAFNQQGSDVSLEDIARQAGVGIATVYRNFPTREDLIEAVYVAEVDAVCRYSEELQGFEPWAALVAWVRRFVSYMATKRVLIDVLDRESGAFLACRDALYESGGALLTRAQEAGQARTDVSIDDVLRFVFGVTGTPFRADEQRDRILQMAIDGIRA
jgi:AcrR family transcriptional regulator